MTEQPLSSAPDLWVYIGTGGLMRCPTCAAAVAERDRLAHSAWHNTVTAPARIPS